MTEVAGKIVYITGGASGMGLAAARMLAAIGAHVVTFDRSPNSNAHLAVALARRSRDQRVACYQLNVADREAVLSTVKKVGGEFGAPDIAINMAAIGGAAEFADMKFEVFDRIMQVNLYGARHFVEAVLPLMTARGCGKIVLVGSMGGLVPVCGDTAYGASRSAVVGLSQCLRYELKPRGISVACFCPGEVETSGLAEKRKTLHPVSAALKKIGGTISAESAVRGLIEGIRRDDFMIVPGFKVRLACWMHRLLPERLWNAVTDEIVRRAIRTVEPPGEKKRVSA
jgi:3-dehydrosphinganine reductase